jgi:hypothetical protein
MVGRALLIGLVIVGVVLFADPISKSINSNLDRATCALEGRDLCIIYNRNFG